MTTEEKKEIIKLYDNGIGYKKIASIVGVSIGSIRNVLNDREERCPVCGKKLIFIAGKKKKRFCSDACRYQTLTMDKCFANIAIGLKAVIS